MWAAEYCVGIKKATDADKYGLLQGTVINGVLLIWFCAGNDN